MPLSICIMIGKSQLMKGRVIGVLHITSLQCEAVMHVQ